MDIFLGCDGIMRRRVDCSAAPLARKEIPTTTERIKRPFRPRPTPERIDVAAVQQELAARYPKIRAALTGRTGDALMEHWLREEVAPVFGRVAAGAEPLVSADDVLGGAAERYRARKA
ncbi:hypothetical protein [Methylobacterium sp. 17Sr1-1]|uniref:hypothetical protein n=1 Tax=Methylobacterium sp. 17Sr1-1 TaxID=2202826 RepID=UPI0013A5A4D5|nr:hypothetical protein [Methylobacterium sp. 17Sr1-1]